MLANLPGLRVWARAEAVQSQEVAGINVSGMVSQGESGLLLPMPMILDMG